MCKYRVDTSTMRFCPKYTPLQSSGTCSAAGLIKAFSTVLTWAPRSGSTPDVQKFQQPCHRSSCVITSLCSLPPPKQNAFSDRIWGWRRKRIAEGRLLWVSFSTSAQNCGYNFRCGNELLHAELIWGKGQPCAREVAVSMGGAQREPWHLFCVFFFALYFPSPLFFPYLRHLQRVGAPAILLL